MLANNTSVDVARVNIEHVPQRVFETRAIEYGARTHYALAGEARKLHYYLCEDIYRVRNHQENAVKALFHNAGNDGLEDCYILLYQVETRFAWLLVSASGDDNDGGIGKIFVSASVDVHGTVVRNAVADVERFAFGSVGVYIDKNHVGEKLALHQAVCSG